MTHQLLTVVTLSTTLLFALGGCTPHNATPAAKDGTRGTVSVFRVDVGDRTIPCVGWKAGYAGGLSCDWSR